ncbi:thioredoxin family protein [Chryseobacterium caseinilyticum]|uniref:Thioredoxin family protein n=1 Tax=Chryseobacterium caseinilyticum TaxID=2771428 RepID=A0ABR8ZA50_9FLAO|nr:thioredoxin family protein [Chryseobacterium caseinilyticum]MBD8082110.1 thioredoxin family protein [Chryseobacterium caseinilyticum]
MKNLVTTFFILIFSFTFAQEEGIKFDQSSFKDLLAKAKKEKKLVFIDAYAVWCGPCKMMDRNVFTQKSVGDYFNKSFISSRIDMEKGEGREIAQKFSVRSYPTYLFLNGDGEMVSQNYGYMEPGLFLSMAQDVNAGNSKGGSLKDRFAKGESSPEFLMNIMKLNSTSDFDFAKKASEKYFAKKKTNEPLTKEEAGFLFFFIKSSKDANFKYLVDKKSEIIQFLPEESYNEYKNQILLADIMETAIDTKNNRVDDAKFMATAEPLVGKEVATKKLNQIKLGFYEQNANYAEYEKVALEYYKNSDLFEANETLKAAWIFAEHVKDKTSLKKAAEWAEKSVMRGETAENTYILAKIYFMMDNKNLAKSFAEMSNSLAKQTGKDAALSEELLNQIKK